MASEELMASLDWLAMKYCFLSIYIVAFKYITYKILAYCHFYTTKNKPDLEHVHLMYPSVDVKSSLEKSLWFFTHYSWNRSVYRDSGKSSLVSEETTTQL